MKGNFRRCVVSTLLMAVVPMLTLVGTGAQAARNCVPFEDVYPHYCVYYSLPKGVVIHLEAENEVVWLIECEAILETYPAGSGWRADATTSCVSPDLGFLHPIQLETSVNLASAGNSGTDTDTCNDCTFSQATTTISCCDTSVASQGIHVITFPSSLTITQVRSSPGGGRCDRVSAWQIVCSTSYSSNP